VLSAAGCPDPDDWLAVNALAAERMLARPVT
jgi:hypothetical protein